MWASATLVLALCCASRVLGDDGHLDPSFGTAGRGLTSLEDILEVTAALVQPDDRIVVSLARTSHPRSFTLMRFEPDGTIDSSFGTGGFVRTDFTPGFAAAEAVTQQPDGKLVVGGTFGTFTTLGTIQENADFAIVRYEADGTVDASFGVDGKVVTSFSGTEGIKSVLIQPDGRIVAVGSTLFRYATEHRLVLARYSQDGTLDPTFGIGGIATLSVEDGVSAEAASLAGDRILVAGSARVVGANRWVPMVARVASDGSLDATFGSGGATLTDVGSTVSGTAAKALALHADGRIVTVTERRTGIEGGFAIVRHQPDGALDPTFGDGGVALLEALGFYPDARGITVLPDDRIVVTGSTMLVDDRDDRNEIMLVRVEPNGRLDTTFFPCAAPLVRFPGHDSVAKALVRQSTGKLVIAATATSFQEPFKVGLMRFGATTPPCHASRKASVGYRASSRRLAWFWNGNDAVAKAEFGDPLESSSMTVCLFQDAGGVPELLMHHTKPPGGTCAPFADKPCWHETAKGFRYRSNQSWLAFGGSLQLLLTSGPAGRAKISAKMRTDLPLPLASPVTVRATSSDGGSCFESVFPAAVLNDAARFKARR